MPGKPAVISQLFPILATPDIARALGFYRDLLGGTIVFEFPDPSGATVYAGLDIGSSHLGIGLNPTLEGAPRPRSMSLWIYVDDCDSAVERLRAAGVTVIEEPTDQPWGERVARVLDPDGNEVIIGQHAAS